MDSTLKENEEPVLLCQPVNNADSIVQQAAQRKNSEDDTLTPNPVSKRGTKRSNESSDTFRSPAPLNKPASGLDSIDLSSPSCSAKVQKRSDPIKWDDYFMAIAFLSSMRSKDPSTQVGACIVNPDKRIVGMGYNGFPRGCSDDELPWCRQAENELDTKYPYVCHAEVNAILNKNSADVRGCSIYVALFPCNECAKLIIQSGIAEVVYLSDKYRDTPSMMASRRMMTMAGLTLRQYTPAQSSILIDFSQIQPRPTL